MRSYWLITKLFKLIYKCVHIDRIFQFEHLIENRWNERLAVLKTVKSSWRRTPKPKQVLFFLLKSFAGIPWNFSGILLILKGLPTFWDSWNYLRKNKYRKTTNKKYFLLHNTSIKLLFCKATNIIAEIQKGRKPCWTPWTLWWFSHKYCPNNLLTYVFIWNKKIV